MSVNATPREQIQLFYNYDKSVVDKFHMLRFDTRRQSDGQYVENRVLCVFATPERAFAQMALQLARKREGVVDPKDINIKAVPLPIISVRRLISELDMTRYVRVKMNRLTRTADGKHYYGMMMPQPYDLLYQADVWARTQQSLDEISNQILLWLRSNEFYLTVNHPNPFNQRIVLTEFQGMSEVGSEVDPRNDQQRVLRRTFSFVVHGWLCPAALERGIVERIIVNFYDNTLSDPGDLLETAVITDDVGDRTDVRPVNMEPKTTTTLSGGIIVGNAEAGQSYGGVTIPGPMSLIGMQARVLGTPPEGADLILQLEIDGAVDAERQLTIPDGDSADSVIFGTPINLLAGQVLKSYCYQVGSTSPGSWVELVFSVELTLSYS